MTTRAYVRVKPDAVREDLFLCGFLFLKTSWKPVDVDDATLLRLRTDFTLEVSLTDPGSGVGDGAVVSGFLMRANALVDSVTNRVKALMYGQRDVLADLGVVRADVNQVTGGLNISAGAVTVKGDALVVASGIALAERFRAMLNSRRVKMHLYGNSIVVGGMTFLVAAASKSGGRLSIAKNSAVGGYKSSDILAKLIAEGVASNADIVPFMEGTNDAGAYVSNAEHIANMRSIAYQILKAGKIPLLILPPPNSLPQFAATNGYALRELVMAINLGIPVFDPWMILTGNDGKWVAGASADTIHPLLPAHYTSGAELWNLMLNSTPPKFLPRTNAGEGLWGSNVLMATDTNADGLPDGWSPVSLTTPSYALSDASYPVRGKKCAVTVSQSATGYLNRNLTTGFAAGDVIKLSGFARIASGSNLNLAVWLRFTDATSDRYAYSSQAVGGDLEYFEMDQVVPAGCTTIQCYIAVSPAVTGSFSGVAEFAALDFYNMTTLGAL